jgi:hypothetical protein
LIRVRKIDASIPHAAEPGADAVGVQRGVILVPVATPLPEEPGFSTLHGKRVTARMSQRVGMNVLHPDPIGSGCQLTRTVIERRPHSVLPMPEVERTDEQETAFRRCMQEADRIAERLERNDPDSGPPKPRRPRAPAGREPAGARTRVRGERSPPVR